MITTNLENFPVHSDSYFELSKLVVLLLLIFNSSLIGQSFPKTINLDVGDGLIQNTVWAIEEDTAHRIWIGTPGGLQIYDGFQLSALPEVEGTILRLQKHDSSIYCITINALYKFNPLSFTYSKVKFPHSYFYLSKFLSEGIAIVDAYDSLYYFYNYNLQSIDSSYPVITKKDVPGFFDFTLGGIKFNGSIKGLITENSSVISTAYCKQYVQYSPQRVFIASHKGIIEISNYQNRIETKHHFTDLRITHLLVDYNKNLWVATADNGIFMIHRNMLHTSFFPKKRTDGKPLSCWRFCTIENQLYVATAYGLVPVQQNNWKKNKVYLNTKGLAVNTAVEGEGFLIIGTRSNGIYRLKNNKLKQIFVNPENQLDNIIVQIEKNKDGFLASSKYSLIQLDKKGDFISRKITDFDEVFGYTMEFFQYSGGIMNSRTTGVAKLDTDLNLKNNYYGDSVQVVSMLRPFKNQWWGVSMDAGLVKIEEKRIIKMPFPDKHLFTLTNLKDTNLWISGIKAIYQYSHNYVRPFSAANGFPIREYNQNAVHIDSLGFLYYAGVGGIHKFHPDSLAFFPNLPSVLVKQNHKYLSPQSDVNLGFDESQLVLDILPVSISDQNYFKIEIGTDSQWIEVDKPLQLSFTIPYGRSIVHVKITDLIHHRNYTKNYTVFRNLPFWKKPWFIVGVVLVFVLLGIGLISFVEFIKTKKQNKLARIRIEEQKKGLTAVIQAQEEERKRIAKDLHDGIVQQLGGLKLGLQRVFADNKTKETKKLVRILDNSAKELRELSHKMMPRSLSELGLVPAMEDMLENSLGNTSIHYRFEHFGIITRFNENIEIAIYRIAQELVNNVIKHSKADKVNVQLFKTGNDVILIVEDNGKGIDILTQKQGIGLMNISSRLDTINGKVNFEPSPESGTLATIKIPIQI